MLVHIPVGTQFLMAVETELLLLPFKLILAYYAMYVFLKSILNDKRRVWLALLQLVLVITGCVLLYRVMDYYYDSPVVYRKAQPSAPFLTVMSYWLSLLDIGPVGAIAVVIKFLKIQFRSMEKERNLVKEKLETELKLLRNQTNPRFLSNTLDSIHSLALKKSDDTPEVIMKLSKLLNFMLYESGKDTISMGNEMEILDNYLELESLRFDGRLEIEFIREIDNETDQIPPMLLLSLVQHAFNHGDSRGMVASYILIDIRLQSGVLTLNMEATREELDRLAPGDNSGLTNIRRQIELSYSDYSLDIEDDQHLFKAGLVIDIHTHEKKN
jgi:hypothetical protein